MINLKIKVDSQDNKKYEKVLSLDDGYIISKQNAVLLDEVKKACEEAPFQDIETVKLSISSWEW